jgi:hypothetical protein
LICQEQQRFRNENNVADIFLSYAREDLSKAKLLANLLQKQGWSVFWDRSLLAGQDFDEVIASEIEQARCMIVAWSKASIKSDWVRGEAKLGRKRDILVPVLFDSVDPPIAYLNLHAEDLTVWKGETDAPAFLALCEALPKRVGSATPSSRPSDSTPTKPDKPRKLTWPKSLSRAFIVILVLLASLILSYRVFYAPTSNDNANNAQTAEPIDSGKTAQSLAKNPKETQPVAHVTTNDPEADKPAKGLLEPAMKRLPSGIAMGDIRSYSG